jgi:hypothetical protein
MLSSGGVFAHLVLGFDIFHHPPCYLRNSCICPVMEDVPIIGKSFLLLIEVFFRERHIFVFSIMQPACFLPSIPIPFFLKDLYHVKFHYGVPTPFDDISQFLYRYIFDLIGEHLLVRSLTGLIISSTGILWVS